MKFKIFTVLLIFCFCKGFGQDKEVAKTYKIGDTIRLVTDLDIKNKIEIKDLSKYFEKEPDASKVKYSFKRLPVNSIFTIKSIGDQNVVLKPWRWKVYTADRIKRRNKRLQFLENNQFDKSTYGKLYNDKVYETEINSFILASEKVDKNDVNFLPPRVSIGVITLPFKFRPQDDTSFDTDFNINTTVNYRIFSAYDYHFHAQLGAGFGKVKLNNGNATLPESSVQDVPTLGFLSGFMLQYQRIQIGLYAGVDVINNQNKLNWDSHGNLWLGFGAGYNLFKNKEKESGNK